MLCSRSLDGSRVGSSCPHALNTNRKRTSTTYQISLDLNPVFQEGYSYFISSLWPSCFYPSMTDTLLQAPRQTQVFRGRVGEVWRTLEEWKRRRFNTKPNGLRNAAGVRVRLVEASAAVPLKRDGMSLLAETFSATRSQLRRCKVIADNLINQFSCGHRATG